MLLSKLPNPPRPCRARLLESPPLRLRLRLPAPSLPTRRRLLPPLASSSSSGSPFEDPPPPPAKRPSSKKAPPCEGGGREVVAPRGIRGSSAPDPDEPPAAARWARAAWRKMASSVPRKARGIVLLNLVAFIFASNISVVKEAETMLDPDLFNMLRFTISAIPFVPILLKSLKDMQIFIKGVELGIWVSMAYLAQAIGLVTADAGRASFISALTVIIVPFLDGILGAKIPLYTWIGAFLSLLGVAILELNGSPPCVLVVALVSAVSFIIKSFLQNVQHWNLKSQSLKELFGMVMSIPWFAILYTGIFSTIFCLWAELAAMRDVSATETAIIYGLEPVWGAAFAWVMFGERFGMTGFVGAIFIIAGSFMVQILGSFPDVPREQLPEEQLIT